MIVFYLANNLKFTVKNNRNGDKMNYRISFAGFVVAISRSKALLFFSFLVPILLSILTLQFVTPYWEAKAYIKIGRVPFERISFKKFELKEPESNLIELPATVAQRLKDPNFISKVFGKINILPNEYKKSVDTYIQTIRVSSPRQSELIEISLSAPTKPLAESILKESLFEIKSEHDLMIDNYINVMNDYAQKLDDEIKKRSDRIKPYENSLKSAKNLDILLAIDKIDEQKLLLMDKKNIIEMINSPIFTSKTEIFGAGVQVARSKGLIRQAIIVVFMGLLGLFFGVLWTIYKIIKNN